MNISGRHPGAVFSPPASRRGIPLVSRGLYPTLGSGKSDECPNPITSDSPRLGLLLGAAGTIGVPKFVCAVGTFAPMPWP